MGDPAARFGVEPSPHLVSAARALERILSEIYPEHDWVVTVGERQRRDRHRYAAALVGTGNAGSVGDDAHSVGDRHSPPAPGGGDEDAFEEAA